LRDGFAPQGPTGLGAFLTLLSLLRDMAPR